MELSKMLDVENSMGIQAKPEIYVNLLNGYGLSATDRYNSVD